MSHRLLTTALLGAALLAGACLHGPTPPPEATSPEPPPAHLPPVLGAPPPPPVAALPAVPPAAALPDAPAAAAPPPRIDFATDVQPLLEGCRPCHFEGGKMYEELPFDDPATVRALGERLFTRITEAEAQALIRAFLAQEG